METKKESFIKKHSKKLIFVGSVVMVTGTYYIAKKYNVKLNVMENDITTGHGVIKKITDRELSRIKFEISALEQYIRKLDPKININSFVNIPNAQERLMVLQSELHEVEIDRLVFDKYAK